MNQDDVYEQWKEQRSLIEAPYGFESEVMARLNDSDADTGVDSSTTQPIAADLLDRPAWAAVAVVAASVFGFARISFALLIGIL